MRNIMYSLIVLITFVATGWAQSLSSIVGQEQATTLLQKGTFWKDDTSANTFLVQNGALKTQMQAYVQELNANFSLEFLYFVPKNTFASRTPAQIIQALLAVNTLGNAYMIRKDKEQPLFKQVEVLNNFKDRVKVAASSPDSLSLPIEHSLFVVLKDARFGKIDYRIDFKADNQVVSVSMLNFDKLSYLGRKISDSQSMRLSFFAQEVAEGTLYVGHIVANIHELSKAKDTIHLPSFFSRRVEGMKGWYFQQVYGIKVAQGIYPVAIRP